MKLTVPAFVTAACVVALAATALAQPPANTAAAPSGEVTLTEVNVTATVEAIDVAQRLLTVKGPAGRVETFAVDEAVKNLAQVKVGDQIVIVYRESLAYEVRKSGPGAPGIEAAVAGAPAKPGEKPGLVAGRQLKATVTITGLDVAAQTLSVKGPAGNERTLRVADPKRLEGLKVGDLVDLTYTEALAVSVQKAPAGK